MTSTDQTSGGGTRSPFSNFPYQETEHYTVTRNFLLRTDQMLKILLGDPEIEE